MFRITWEHSLPEGSTATFYAFQPKHCAKFASNYAEDRLFGERFLSEDGRTWTSTHIWTSKEAYLRFKNDPLNRAEAERARAYNEANGITVKVTTEDLG